MTLPPPPVSSLDLPVSVSLASLQAAADSQLPQQLAAFEQDQPLAGGALGTLHLSGRVTRAGALTVQPEGGGLQLSLPVQASVTTTGVLQKTFTGSASLLLHLTPRLNENWTLGLGLRAEHRWSEPMTLEVLGLRLPLTPIIDPLIQGQLERLSGGLEEALNRAANLRPRAEALWGRLSQPWPLPTPEPGYLAVEPLAIGVTPVTVDAAALHFGVQASFRARGGLGALPQATPLAPPLPPLRQVPAAPAGFQLALPLRLTHAQLSEIATRAAAGRVFQLPALLNPTLRLRRVTVTPASGGRLNAACEVSVSVIGLSVSATVDVSGRPVLDGQTLRLTEVAVHTRPQGLTGRVLGWLADRRAQDFLAQQARFDTAPELARLRAGVQARLPWTLAPGLVLAGELRQLRLTGLDLEAAGVRLSAQALGTLRLDLRANELLGRP